MRVDAPDEEGGNEEQSNSRRLKGENDADDDDDFVEVEIVSSFVLSPRWESPFLGTSTTQIYP
jgi:hypothetical protein